MFDPDEEIAGGGFEDASSVDSDTLRAFVVAAVYANVAVLLVSLGPMLWFFEGRARIGAGLFALGLLAGARTYQTYRAWKRSRDEAAETGDDSAPTDEDSTPANDDPASPEA